MATESEGLLAVEGDITITTYSSKLDFFRSNVSDKTSLIDFSKVEYVDSAAIALMIECIRFSGRPFRFRGLPESLENLISLYGVGDIVHRT